jgi:hypothetical protein
MIEFDTPSTADYWGLKSIEIIVPRIQNLPLFTARNLESLYLDCKFDDLNMEEITRYYPNLQQIVLKKSLIGEETVRNLLQWCSMENCKLKIIS